MWLKSDFEGLICIGLVAVMIAVSLILLLA
jgi:hypothetical protein